jgi:drug/metabolite transporter (DMT)-like permease
VKRADIIVYAVMALVALLAAATMLLDPARWAFALAAMLFLPLAGLFVLRRPSRAGTKAGATLRASMVGAGALLVSALGYALAETTGLVAEGEDSFGQMAIGMVLVLVVVFGDVIAARMEKAGKDEDGDGE